MIYPDYDEDLLYVFPFGKEHTDLFLFYFTDKTVQLRYLSNISWMTSRKDLLEKSEVLYTVDQTREETTDQMSLAWVSAYKKVGQNMKDLLDKVNLSYGSWLNKYGIC